MTASKLTTTLIIESWENFALQLPLITRIPRRRQVVLAQLHYQPGISIPTNILVGSPTNQRQSFVPPFNLSSVFNSQYNLCICCVHLIAFDSNSTTLSSMLTPRNPFPWIPRIGTPRALYTQHSTSHTPWAVHAHSPACASCSSADGVSGWNYLSPQQHRTLCSRYERDFAGFFLFFFSLPLSCPFPPSMSFAAWCPVLLL